MKRIIFDFDGTLVDSMPAWVSSIFHILKTNNITYSDDLIKIITPLGTKGTAEYISNNYPVKETPEEIISIMGKFAFKEYAENIPAKETVIDTLKDLKLKGYSLNVLTASPHITLDPCLKRLSMYDIFDNVWSCDDFGTTKSDVNIYYMTAEKLGTKPQNCIFLDDNINAVATAKKSGMRSIGVYDATSDDMIDEMKNACDGYIFKFSELLEILQKTKSKDF